MASIGGVRMFEKIQYFGTIRWKLPRIDIIGVDVIEVDIIGVAIVGVLLYLS